VPISNVANIALATDQLYFERHTMTRHVLVGATARAFETDLRCLIVGFAVLAHGRGSTVGFAGGFGSASGTRIAAAPMLAGNVVATIVPARVQDIIFADAAHLEAAIAARVICVDHFERQDSPSISAW